MDVQVLVADAMGSVARSPEDMSKARNERSFLLVFGMHLPKRPSFADGV